MKKYVMTLGALALAWMAPGFSVSTSVQTTTTDLHAKAHEQLSKKCNMTGSWIAPFKTSKAFSTVDTSGKPLNVSLGEEGILANVGCEKTVYAIFMDGTVVVTLPPGTALTPPLQGDFQIDFPEPKTN